MRPFTNPAASQKAANPTITLPRSCFVGESAVTQDQGLSVAAKAGINRCIFPQGRSRRFVEPLQAFESAREQDRS